MKFIVLVTAVMASYNHEKYIAQAIESVLNQTFTDLELVIVDDCSTDASPDIIKKYSEKDPRVRAFFHQKNQGIAKTLNDCLKEAQGKYVGFIGSDDMWLPYKLKRQLNLIKGNEDKILWSSGQVIDSNGALTGQKVSDLIGEAPKRSGNLFQDLLIEDFVFGQSVLVKTEYAREVGFDESFRFVNDHLFFINLAKKHEFLYDPADLALYRIHKRNTTALHQETWYRERISLRNKLLESYKGEVASYALADIYYKLGHAYDVLGKRISARHYYLKALCVPQLRANSVLYLLSIGNKGFIGAQLERHYKKMLSLLASRKLQFAG